MVVAAEPPITSIDDDYALQAAVAEEFKLSPLPASRVASKDSSAPKEFKLPPLPASRVASKDSSAPKEFKLPPLPASRAASNDSSAPKEASAPEEASAQIDDELVLQAAAAATPVATKNNGVFKVPHTPTPGTKPRRTSTPAALPPTPATQLKKRKTFAEQEWNTPNSSKRVKLDKRPSPYVQHSPAVQEKPSYDIDDATPRSKRLRRLELDRLMREAGSEPQIDPELEDSVSFAIMEEDEDDRDDFKNFLREGFTAHEAALFQRIRKRGREWLFPDHWRLDFPTVPENLFAPAEAKEVGAIDSLTLDGSYNAKKAFEDVMELGTRTRDRILVGADPEPKVVSCLERYMKWSLDDYRTYVKGDGPDIHPRIVISSCKGRGPDYGQARMHKKLRRLAENIRAEDARIAALGYPRDPKSSSTLFGFAVHGALVAVVSYDAQNRNPSYEERTLTWMDWTDMTFDFWNAVTVALTVIAAREDETERNKHYIDNDLLKVPTPGLIRGGWANTAAPDGSIYDDDEDA